jgi:glycosyltransferase involved in cell wall biosynthesis
MSYFVDILLPGSGHAPLGGQKIAYEYANGLAARGHQVTLVHPAILYRDAPFSQITKKFVRYLQRKVDGSYRPNRWFKMDPRVELKWVPTLHPRYIPDSDVVIATAWQTAEWLNTYPAVKGKKTCLVYDYEHYMSADAAMQKRIGLAFARCLKAIATSPAVSEMLSASGASDTVYIPNGIDFEVFFDERTLNDPLRNSIGFPTRSEPFKGTKDAISALSIVRERFKQGIHFWSFGGRRPGHIPDWIEYHERPSDKELRGLYNQTLIFAVPSHYEGWGLPGAEAMSCGAALASTDNGGVRAYATHLRNSLLSPPCSPAALAENVLQLLNDSTLRKKLAEQGRADIRQFTWHKAIDSLEQLIEELCCVPASSKTMLPKPEASAVLGA